MKDFIDFTTGEYIDNTAKYTEITRLNKMFLNDGLTAKLKRLYDGYQLKIDGYDFDVIEHHGSYGQQQDRLEIMGLYTMVECDGDRVLGYLTAEEIYNKFYEVYPKQV